MDAHHTPGPWEISFGQTGYPRGIHAPHDINVRGGVGSIIRWNGIGFPSSPVALANARLIAAAPDLLDALRVARALIFEAHHDMDPKMVASCSDVMKIDAALAKAEGRS